MFSSSKKIIDPVSRNTSIDTLIGESAIVEGDIKTQDVLKIDGKITGNIISESEVVVGECGYIKGNITAVDITISGKVDGNVFSKGVLKLMPTGELIGDVDVKNISISPGAIFIGKCSMNTNIIEEIANKDA